MNGKNPILVATDFSARAAPAVQRAAMLAAQRGCPLQILHVIDSVPLQAVTRLASRNGGPTGRRLEEDARQELAKLAHAVARAHGIEVNAEVRIGRPYQEIVDRATAQGAALTVVGAHGEDFFADLFVGSVAQKVVRRGGGSTLIVKRAPGQRYGNIVVASDFSPASKLALETALELAGADRLTVLHVYRVPFERELHYSGVSDAAFQHYREAARQQAADEADAFLREFRGAAAPLRRLLRYGHAPAVISEYARETGAELIVMGAQGRSELSYLMLGSVTLHVMPQAPCDVLVAKLPLVRGGL